MKDRIVTSSPLRALRGRLYQALPVEGATQAPIIDTHHHALLANVRPPHWVNPKPMARYNLVVIGAGPAGLVTAAIGAALGAKVALIERHLMGGDCLNTGCVPSKGILRAARAWAESQNTARFGITLPAAVQYDFSAVMERMRALRAALSPADSAERYKNLGVDVFIGEGKFVGSDAVEVGGERLRFKKAVICTGTRPAVPPIPGLAETCLTNETVFTLTQRPNRMAIIGAGPIGCEMAQGFARLGCSVSLLEKGNRVLPREDADAAHIVENRMRREGVSFLLESNLIRVETRGSEKIIDCQIHGVEKTLAVDAILVGVGRTPNIERLDMDKAGVQYDLTAGINVNDKLQTTNPHIFAAGDVCSPFKFTHAAEAAAKIVIQNALFPHPFGLGYAHSDTQIIPWCTYTDPEIAHVGMNEADAKVQGIPFDVYTVPLSHVDRAVLDDQDEGFARVYVKRQTDKILGATIVATHAGDMISLLTLAIHAGMGLRGLSDMIYPYPTQTEIIKKVANEWRKSTFTEGKKKGLRRWFAWTR